MDDITQDLKKMLEESFLATAKLEASIRKMLDLIQPKDVGDYDNV